MSQIDWLLFREWGVSSQRETEASVEYSTAESGSVPVSDLMAHSLWLLTRLQSLAELRRDVGPVCK